MSLLYLDSDGLLIGVVSSDSGQINMPIVEAAAPRIGGIPLSEPNTDIEKARDALVKM
jgi:hypothetical protein